MPDISSCLAYAAITSADPQSLVEFNSSLSRMQQKPMQFGEIRYLKVKI